MRAANFAQPHPHVPTRHPVVPSIPASVSAVKMRVRATKNVSKITGVMKLVASSKLRSVEERLYRGRAFGVS
jgi:hypothetical protein